MTTDSKAFAIIFDMDGVIADTNPFHQKSIKEFCRKYGKEVSDDFLEKKIYGRTNQDWLPEIFTAIDQTTLNAYADEKEALFRKMYTPYLEPVKGLKEFLESLKQENIKTAVATSAPKDNADFILEGLDIADKFNEVLHSAHVTQGKPHPQIYLKTCQALYLSPKRCIVIEDSLSGVRAAQDAGCKVIGITTTHTEDELASCDLVIKDFSLLNISVLEGLLEEPPTAGM